ncbi:hypothetical protein CEXT_47661 [Caerostris extrusa]|uniref:Uncharacterized protein n=1 Tax=Caerostris extrusa TaxID=172846 RepID=A0AAV4W246_CAEEX|nr:hypothetical protein CEXT_47661 [Caerostris extrusa]
MFTFPLIDPDPIDTTWMHSKHSIPPTLSPIRAYFIPNLVIQSGIFAVLFYTPPIPYNKESRKRFLDWNSFYLFVVYRRRKTVIPRRNDRYLYPEWMSCCPVERGLIVISGDLFFFPILPISSTYFFAWKERKKNFLDTKYLICQTAHDCRLHPWW